jgi:hypothetical protein
VVCSDGMRKKSKIKDMSICEESALVVYMYLSLVLLILLEKEGHNLKKVP